MPDIVIVSSSIRTARESHYVALYLKNFIDKSHAASTTLCDLQAYDFPLFTESFKDMHNPAPGVVDFANKIEKADGVIMVTPEYNGSYPASLKNVIDLLYAAWYKKPVALATVSDGAFGGTQVMMALQQVLWKIKATVVPHPLPVPHVSKSFNVEGASHPDIERRADLFIKELLWHIEARKRMHDYVL